MAPVEVAADMEEAGHIQGMDTEAADDKGQDVEVEAAGSYRLEDRDDSDRPGERDPRGRGEEG